MAQDNPMQDPLDFIKNMWSNLGVPLPGMVTPTLDVGELDKRIADMKAVEGWLKMNLNMLQMSIQGLEMQRATIAAVQAMSVTASSPEPAANPFTNPALWPWAFMQPSGTATGQPPGTKPDAPA